MPDEVRSLLIRIRDIEKQREKCLSSTTHERLARELEQARARLKQLQQESNNLML